MVFHISILNLPHTSTYIWSRANIHVTAVYITYKLGMYTYDAHIFIYICVKIHIHVYIHIHIYIYYIYIIYIYIHYTYIYKPSPPKIYHFWLFVDIKEGWEPFAKTKQVHYYFQKRWAHTQVRKHIISWRKQSILNCSVPFHHLHS